MSRTTSEYVKLFPENLQMDPNVLAKFYVKYLPDMGTFVEVGAFDGVSWSHSSCLAMLGWKGMYIEPYPAYAGICADNHIGHPKVTVVNKACSHTKGRGTLYVKDATSTLILDKASRTYGVSENDTYKVNIDTLNNILEDYDYGPFDLLVIDVEGAEADVLEGFDIDIYKPRLAIVETHELSGYPYLNDQGVNEVLAACDAYFSKASYTKLHSDPLNTFYLANDFYKDR